MSNSVQFNSVQTLRINSTAVERELRTRGDGTGIENGGEHFLRFVIGRVREEYIAHTCKAVKHQDGKVQAAKEHKPRFSQTYGSKTKAGAAKFGQTEEFLFLKDFPARMLKDQDEKLHELEEHGRDLDFAPTEGGKVQIWLQELEASFIESRQPKKPVEQPAPAPETGVQG